MPHALVLYNIRLLVSNGCLYLHRVELNDKDMPPESIEAVLNKWSTTSVKSKTTAGNEIKYPLPYSAVPNFPSLFSDLEKLKNDTTKNIQSYGISMTSLEEVPKASKSSKCALVCIRFPFCFDAFGKTFIPRYS